MPSRVIVIAVLSLGLLAPGAACARACDPASETPVSSYAADAPMPCHGDAAPVAAPPLESDSASCLDACPLCTDVWLPSVATSDPAPNVDFVLSTLRSIDLTSVRGGDRLLVRDRWPPTRRPEKSSVLRL